MDDEHPGFRSWGLLLLLYVKTSGLNVDAILYARLDDDIRQQNPFVEISLL